MSSRPGTNAHTEAVPPAMVTSSTIPAMVSGNPVMIRVRWANRRASRPAARDATSRPPVSAVKMTPVWIAS